MFTFHFLSPFQSIPDHNSRLIQFISHSVNPLHGVDHKDVESVIRHRNIHNIQQYSWVVWKSMELHIWAIKTLPQTAGNSITLHYYTFAFSKIFNK